MFLRRKANCSIALKGPGSEEQFMKVGSVSSPNDFVSPGSTHQHGTHSTKSTLMTPLAPQGGLPIWPDQKPELRGFAFSKNLLVFK